jgi:hypothetical protein
VFRGYKIGCGFAAPGFFIDSFRIRPFKLFSAPRSLIIDTRRIKFVLNSLFEKGTRQQGDAGTVVFIVATSLR